MSLAILVTLIVLAIPALRIVARFMRVGKGPLRYADPTPTISSTTASVVGSPASLTRN
jgi:hypothetical protein